ncbi:hypothetical protein HX004_06335 [Myroides sp. 1354]|uniref:hypothetical protein n=1 Tax=unclassified Myroides TaxID=2642485 RepID=UPI0025760EDA|nr:MULTISPECIES: hypothetical protein [unclassified Myroides]MDM1044679.1 hypothetical protein [Myroides sp. R163-1]MDM1055392.1 hypothetical protein [Myroides sp. 1354]MDM1068689.1 hypothetical protein [Myroides sp. 1372]
MMDLKKYHLYLYTFCRYFIATIIISYALAKLVETQFITQPSVYDKPISDLSGFQLTWYYYGYSFWYGAVIAGAQLTSAILLFFRKTTRIGILLFLTFMVNILLVDFAYDIQGAKGMAVLLTLMGFFVFLSDFKIFFTLLIQEPPLFTNIDRPQWFNKISKVKYVYIPLVFIGFFVLLTTLKQEYLGSDQFTGAWENVETKERLYFEAAHSFQEIKPCRTEPHSQGIYEIKENQLILITKENQQQETHLTYDFTLKDDRLTLLLDNQTIVYKKIR